MVLMIIILYRRNLKEGDLGNLLRTTWKVRFPNLKQTKDKQAVMPNQRWTLSQSITSMDLMLPWHWSEGQLKAIRHLRTEMVKEVTMNFIKYGLWIEWIWIHWDLVPLEHNKRPLEVEEVHHLKSNLMICNMCFVIRWLRRGNHNSLTNSS